jgi:beta-lactamase class A
VKPPPRHAWSANVRRGPRFTALMCAVALAAALGGAAGGWFAGTAGAGARGAGPRVEAHARATLPPPRRTATPPPFSGPQSAAASTVAAPSPAPDPGASQAAGLAAAVASVEAATGAKLGVAVAAAGGGDRPVEAGSWASGHAWSTIKAPLAVAALEAAPGPAADSAAVRAITVSDNAGAEALWDALGASEQAGAAVDGVLRAGGDAATVTQRTKTRSEFSPYGQTTWSLAAQASFAARFPAGAAGDRVWDLRGQIAPPQRWGLGRFDGAHFTGGWGPDDSGYVVRQFGQVPASDGCTAVALGAWAPNFDAGTRALSQLADAMKGLVDSFPSGPCR